MYDNFKVANYPFSVISPEMFARHMAHLFEGSIIDGFNVEVVTGLQIAVRPGNALIRYGTGLTATARLTSLVADFPRTLDGADPSNPRIDAVVLYIDNSVNLPVVDASNPPTAANTDGRGVAKVIVVKGSPNANPQAPSTVAIEAAVTGGNPYTILADITVGAGVTNLTQANVSTARRSDLVLNGVKLKPASVSPSKMALKPKSMTITLNSTTGTQVITGVGFRPSVILTQSLGTGNVMFTASGIVTDEPGGIQQSCTATRVEGSATQTHNEARAFLHMTSGGSGLVRAEITQLTDDGFVINITTMGTTSSGPRQWRLTLFP